VSTVVDTSALIAVLNDDDAHHERALELLGRASESGALRINDVVYAELAAYFDREEDLQVFVDDTGLVRDGLESGTLYLAGRRYREYLDRRGEELQCSACGHETTFECPDCGEPITARQHVAPDFLIGAHAERGANRLLTFDGGFFETYFDVDLLTVN